MIVVEYNAKFPPPMRFVMPYDPQRVWDGSDYFGASLTSWVELMENHGYRLVCCSYMGLNAFFIRREDAESFSDVPHGQAALFRPALYVNPFAQGHPVSAKTLEVLESVGSV